MGLVADLLASVQDEPVLYAVDAVVGPRFTGVAAAPSPRSAEPVAAGVAYSGAGELQAGLPERLFSVDEKALRSFGVAPGGQRFLLNLAEPESLDLPDHVVVDWTRLMKK